MRVASPFALLCPRLRYPLRMSLTSAALAFLRATLAQLAARFTPVEYSHGAQTIVQGLSDLPANNTDTSAVTVENLSVLATAIA